MEGRDDGDLTDRATVDIDILNVNQNKPTFIMPASLNATVEVPEVGLVFKGIFAFLKT